MKYLSVCSGIEAATVAWHDLGWEPVGFSEIEPFPSALLAHHYPNVTNFGDMTQYKEWNIEQPDILVGGTPCQSFSVAGLRKGLEDPRGNLALVYCGILDQFRPQWFVWENVPGVLSSNGGRDFGSFLGAVAELGYGFSYRVLDAQYFGVAQRRRRVFVVGHIGDWRPAASVLFERQSLRRDNAPSREKRKVTPTISSSGTGVSRVGFNCDDEWFIETPVAGHRMVAFGEYADDDTASAMKARDYKDATDLITQSIAFENNRRDGARIHGDVTQTLQAFCGTGGGNTPMVNTSMAVRRLTPVECERLQGFPDNYTNIPWRKKEESPDGPRYKALGNSMAVPCMQWIGQQIKSVEEVLQWNK